MIEKIKRALLEENLIEKGDTVLVGLSGGPDSLCLFDCLCNIREELGLMLMAVHVNHRLRPDVCDQEQERVEKWCYDLDIPCYSMKVNCLDMAKERSMTSEEAGREARYEAFLRASRTIKRVPGKSVKIALAHNLEDQGETILMRILRGTGTDGLGGMDYRRQWLEDTLIVRPLLGTSRIDIEKYLEEKGLVANQDRTNQEPIYQRNKLRLELIPYIEEHYNPNITDCLNRLGENARGDRNYFQTLAKDAIEKASIEKGRYSIQKMLDMEAPVRKRAYVMILAEIGLEQDFTFAHIEAINHLLVQRKTGSSIDLPRGYRVKVQYEDVIFYNENKGNANKALPMDILCSKLKLPEGAVVRTRQAGDFISLDMVGRKKIQDFFVDEKVPRSSRDELPLVAKGGQVIAILGEDILLSEAVNEIITEEENVGPGFGLIRTRVAKGYKLKFEGGYWIIEQTS
ncbi:MAG: tRNA lysidine(34) synthetase TilS [Anaerovoracaceae bacterium]|jgi:tRNA(Ile)-lysidine synthase|nr:tRNA lysidine(34) synthetase TilS [Anaerovoracaceae bacterium]